MTQRRSMFLIFGFTVVASAWICHAGPFLRQQPGMSGELLSLAGLHQVQLHVEPLQPLLTSQGMTTISLNRMVRGRLREANIEVVDTANAPVVKITAWPGAEPALPKALAFNLRISLYQHATVERVKQRLFVPTYTDFNLGLDKAGKINETMKTSITVLLDRFLLAVSVATINASDR
jgi:hypothetical protein